MAAFASASGLIALIGAFFLMGENPSGGVWDSQPDLQVQQALSHTLEVGMPPYLNCAERWGECGNIGRCNKGPALYKEAPDCNRQHHGKDCCVPRM